MKKLFFLFNILLYPLLSLGQYTAVTATITSPDGYLFSNGTVTATFIPPTGNINCNVYTIGTTPMGGPNTPCIVHATMSASGVFNMILVDDHKVEPFGAVWTFTVCPSISAPCQQSLQDVFGSSIDLSTNISNSLVPFTGTGYSFPEYYSDSEVDVQNGVNSVYFNVINNLIRFWDGNNWNSLNSSVNIPNGFYNTTTGTFNFPQLTNGNTVINGNRATDTNCTGPFVDYRNQANNTDLFVVDCNGVVQTPEIFISGNNPQIAIPITNSATGTTSSLLAKTIGGQWQTITTSDTAIPSYPILPSNTVNGNVVCAPGTSGSACAVLFGVTTCKFDAGGGTIDHFVGASTTSAGSCKDLGTTLPAGPICILGKLLTSPGGSANGTVLVSPFCYKT